MLVRARKISKSYSPVQSITSSHCHLDSRDSWIHASMSTLAATADFLVALACICLEDAL